MSRDADFTANYHFAERLTARFPPPPNENEWSVRPSFLSFFLLPNGAPERERRLLRFGVGLRREGGRRIIAVVVVSLSLSLSPSIELTCTYHMRRRPPSFPLPDEDR